jgi:DNA-binding NtrC family response regulator
MLRIGIVEDDIDALINVIRNLLTLDSSRYRFELVPLLLSDPAVDTERSIQQRVQEYGIGRLDGLPSMEWPKIVQLGLLCPVEASDRAQILRHLSDANVDAIISDSWLGRGTTLESTFGEKALKLGGMMLLDDAEKNGRWTGKCWIMTMYQDDVFDQLRTLLESEGWVPEKFNVFGRFLKKDKINVTAPGKCYRQLERVVDECLARTSLSQPVDLSPAVTSQTDRFGSLVGGSDTMRKLYDRILKVAPREVPVVVHGESGVGKELVVREIHRLSARKDGPFIPVDCGAIPADLMEAELFGHVKGGFTGAAADKAGLFEEARNGTVFLDEIANLPIAMQAKLLRALQEGEVRRVGSNKLISFDARVLAATNKHLETEVSEGRFRGDLLQRISVFQIQVPPLRERERDIRPLCNHFINKHAAALANNVKGISDEAVEVLARFSWPWNVRQLENVLREALIEAVDADIIDHYNEAIRKIAALTAAKKQTDGLGSSVEQDSSSMTSLDECADKPAAEIFDLLKGRRLKAKLYVLKSKLNERNFIELLQLLQQWARDEYNRGYPPEEVTQEVFDMDSESYRQRMYQYKQRYRI